jgi:hypothetical protein
MSARVATAVRKGCESFGALGSAPKATYFGFPETKLVSPASVVDWPAFVVDRPAPVSDWPTFAIDR